ncbi:uncharacterized protein RHIMIDRAFT_281924 [Rhizopus microsporus ATCC 52813]|uniref:Uncharacterized protein n=1 Tax=Rhizopus microsporus ATCC 52813 TaxID=1340429 RepID=A0A2G4SUF3_RHIZD|nr:uncharacterized protein RHIMIDRAFT_281924 [Rhizopus microsporus ATCC 52813]PHZ12390.1 hypothetical protein RHIMIDRAFT_281924 [Rhizopus microsporus ATCC 52813]
MNNYENESVFTRRWIYLCCTTIFSVYAIYNLELLCKEVASLELAGRDFDTYLLFILLNIGCKRLLFIRETLPIR